MQNFDGFKQNIVFGSEEYKMITLRKIYLSLRGFKSHPKIYDIMSKDGEFYHVEKNSFTLINKSNADMFSSKEKKE